MPGSIADVGIVEDSGGAAVDGGVEGRGRSCAHDHGALS
jgi:hypothetical protein